MVRKIYEKGYQTETKQAHLLEYFNSTAIWGPSTPSQLHHAKPQLKKNVILIEISLNLNKKQQPPIQYYLKTAATNKDKH